MTNSSERASSPFANRVMYPANMACAICGGLSLVVAVTAPLDMKTATWGSLSEAMGAACVRGGLPFLCAASIVLSRWFLRRGAGAIAVAIAGIPLFFAAALLTLGMVGGVSARILSQDLGHDLGRGSNVPRHSGE